MAAVLVLADIAAAAVVPALRARAVQTVAALALASEATAEDAECKAPLVRVALTAAMPEAAFVVSASS